METNNNKNNNLDNINMDELKKNVLSKLEDKIVVEEFKEKENIVKINDNVNKKIKRKNNFALKVASFIVAIMLVGNVYTYAAYKENLFSFILSRAGIIDNYSEKGMEVNKEDISMGNSLTLQSYALDGEDLLITYNLKFEEKPKYFEEFLEASAKLKNSKGEVYSLTNQVYVKFYKISDLEYEIVEVYDVQGYDFDDNTKFITDVTLYQELDGPIEDKLGTWNFEIMLDNITVVQKEEYEINKELITYFYNENGEKDTFKGLDETAEPYYVTATLTGFEKTGLGTKLIFNANLYTNVEYFVEVLDENGNVLLENNTEEIVSIENAEILFKEIDLNTTSKLIINIDCIDYTDEGKRYIASEGQIILDLKNDLKVKEEVKLEYSLHDWNIFTFELDEFSEYDVYEYEPEGKTLSVQFNKNINGINSPIGFFTVNEKVNNNYSFEDFVKIQRLKVLSSSEGIGETEGETEYGFGLDMFINDKALIDIALNGKTTYKGKKITEKDLVENAYFKVSEIKEEEFDGYKGYVIDSEEAEISRKHVYVSIDGKIYEFDIPKDLESKEETEKLIKSFKIK